MDTIKHYSGFPATGVSLRQMVQFGERPSTGTFAFCLICWGFISFCWPAFADFRV